MLTKLKTGDEIVKVNYGCDAMNAITEVLVQYTMARQYSSQ
jgi:hypothetical protein